MEDEVWILGAAGRTGRAVARALGDRDIAPVHVGRDRERLEAVAGAGARTLVTASIQEVVDAIRARRPAVVVNTIAPFAETAAAILPDATHYVDVANDVTAVAALLDRDAELAATGRTAVTGAGFGLTASESVLLRLLDARPAPRSVRVDMLPSLASEGGVVGESLAASLLAGLASRSPGEGGLGEHAERVVLPDGTRVRTASMPLGDGVAARRASGAASVVAASDQAPPRMAAALLGIARLVLAARPVRAVAQRALAGARMPARPARREHSWARARAEWADGTVREAWLRTGDAWEFTGAVPAELARRLLAGEGRPGAFTPGALFGTSLAESCGALFLDADRSDTA